MIRKKIKKVFDNTDLMLLIFILIASILFTKNGILLKFVQGFINIAMLIFAVFKLYKKQNLKIVKTKLDLFVIILIFSTMIPLICNSYVSLSGTIKVILDYITIFWIYILIKYICEKNENRIIHIKNITIVFSIILIFLGIENLTANKLLGLLGVDNIINGENRLVSLITNPNSLASLIMFTFFISINEMLNTDSDKKRICYGICNNILILGIVLTYSKLTYLVFGFMLIIYFITLKNKYKRIYLTNNVVQSLIMSLVYLYILQILSLKEYYVSVLIFTILWIEISLMFNRLILKINLYLEKIKLIKIIITILTVAVILMIIVFIELHNKKEFVVFEENTHLDYNSKKINNIKPNEKYVFSFDMKAESFTEDNRYKEDMFTIKIIERNSKSLDEIKSTEFVFGNFEGKKDIEITTTQDTSEIKLEFKAKSSDISKKWIINSLLINGKEKILEYKHLPTKLIEKISDININYRTSQERIVFIKDGLKLISNNFLTGIGGNGWQHKYGEVQEYGYTTNDTHSYYIQIMLEFGIVGAIGILGIIVLVIKSKYKDDMQKSKYNGIKFAILALLLHTSLDSEMMIWYIQVILFVYLALFSMMTKSLKNEIKLDRFRYLSNYGVIIISTITTVLLLIPNIYQKEYVVNNLMKEIGKYEEDSEEYQKWCIKLYKQNENLIKYERYNEVFLNSATQSMYYYILSYKDDIENKLEEYYERMCLAENKWKHNSNLITQKSKCITVIMKELEDLDKPKFYDWLLKLSTININEYEQDKMELSDVCKEEHKDLVNQLEYRQLQENYEYAKRAYDRYYLGVKVNNSTQVDLKEFIKDNELQIENKDDIIIYHTHTTEAFKSDAYKETEFRKTLDENYNIVRVGEKLTNSLLEKGFKVKHINKYNDINGVYRSL